MSITVIVFVMVHKTPSGSCVNHGLQPAKLLESFIISGNRFLSLLNWERSGKRLLTSPMLNMSTLEFSHPTCCSAGCVAKFVCHVGCEWRPV